VVFYLASNNPGKLREFRQPAFAGISVEPVPCINDLPPCVEDGPTFEENARKKALHYSAYLQGLTFADDSGLCVDALGGAPGIHSARFGSLKLAQSQSADAGVLNVSRDDLNNVTLLRQLEGVPDELRTAHYVCVIALAQNGRVLKIAEGRVNGLITTSPRGSGGFGYDPYFFYPPLAKTFAEMSPVDKSSVSHRGHAFRRLLADLNQALEPRRKEPDR
jgi:XTP/dITP diphosphohydrolase